MHLKKLLALGLSLTMAVAPAERLRPARDRGRRYPVGAGYHLPNADEEAITAMTNALNAGGYAGQYVFQTFGTSELGEAPGRRDQPGGGSGHHEHLLSPECPGAEHNVCPLTFPV